VEDRRAEQPNGGSCQVGLRAKGSPVFRFIPPFSRRRLLYTGESITGGAYLLRTVRREPLKSLSLSADRKEGGESICYAAASMATSLPLQSVSGEKSRRRVEKPIIKVFCGRQVSAFDGFEGSHYSSGQRASTLRTPMRRTTQKDEKERKDALLHRLFLAF